jgi:hypothetical protein
VTDKDGNVIQHPWAGENGIRLVIVIRSGKSHDKLNSLADHANKHCLSSEMMKRDFPVEVDKFVLQEKHHRGFCDDAAAIDWDAVPVYCNMDKYEQVSKQDKHMVTQEANMTWNLDNDGLSNKDPRVF